MLRHLIASRGCLRAPLPVLKTVSMPVRPLFSLRREHRGRPRVGGGWLALLGLGGTAHILWRTSVSGIGINNDAVEYLTAAYNLVAGEGLAGLNQPKFVRWPPFLPLLLAAGGSLGMELTDAGRYLNALAYGLTIAVAGFWLRRHLASRVLMGAALAVITAFPALSEYASYLMSEPLFVLLTLLALAQMSAWSTRPAKNAWGWLWGAAACAGLAAVTRYAGVILILTGCLTVLALRNLPWRSKGRYAGAYVVVASLPLAGALARNWLVSGTLTGDRSQFRALSPTRSAFDALGQASDVFQQWLFAMSHPPDGAGWLLVGAVLLGGAGYGWLYLRPGPARRAGADAALPLLLFAAAYVAFFAALAPWAFHTRIDTRYLLPLYVPLALAGALLLDQGARTPRRSQRLLVALGLMGCLAHAGLSARVTFRFTAGLLATGYFPDAYLYNSRPWVESETLAYVRATGLQGGRGRRVFSNSRHGVYWWTGRADQRAYYRWLPEGLRGLRAWREAEEELVYVVWLYSSPGSGYGHLDVRALPGTDTVADLADGAVFRAQRGGAIDEDAYRANKRDYIRRFLQAPARRVVRARFDVYVDAAARTLAFFKEPCRPEDTQARFILHVFPVHAQDLPEPRRPIGFDNLGRDFHRHGARFEGQCLVSARLPAYAIARIRVGQFDSRARHAVWEEVFAYPAAGVDARAGAAG